MEHDGAYLLGGGLIRAQLSLPPRRWVHSGRPRAKTEPTSPAEGGRFNIELPNTQRHHPGKQVQSVGPSSPITALVRFRLHTWPTVSTYVCPSGVQTVCLAYCFHTRNLSGAISRQPSRDTDEAYLLGGGFIRARPSLPPRR